MTDLRQAAQAVLDAWDSPLWKTGTTAAKIADLRVALRGWAEPSQWRDMVVVNLVREGVNKHKARELADHFAAPPQRQWVGLTDEDVNRESAPITSQMKLAFHAGMYVAQQILKERNT